MNDIVKHYQITLLGKQFVEYLEGKLKRGYIYNGIKYYDK
jgi:hypothetical protein